MKKLELTCKRAELLEGQQLSAVGGFGATILSAEPIAQHSAICGAMYRCVADQHMDDPELEHHCKNDGGADNKERQNFVQYHVAFTSTECRGCFCLRRKRRSSGARMA